MAVKNTKEASSLSLLLGLLLLVSLSAPSLSQQVQKPTSIYDWVAQPGTTGGGSCVPKKDAALAGAEAVRVNNIIDPATETEGWYKTIGESIANIPDGSTKRYVLTLKPGVVYREKLFIGKSKPFVTIRSEDPYNPAVIVWNDTAATPGKDGKPLGPDGSSTVTVESDYFIASGVVFRNDAPPPKQPWARNGEAPALRLLGTKATIYNCTVEGGQGALYDQKGLHYYKSSTIRGTVDIIFGSARSFYEDCIIIAVDKTIAPLPVAQQPRGTPYMIKATPGESGFAFKSCIIQGEGNIYLGRVETPVVYSYSKMEKLVMPIIVSSDKALVPDFGDYYAVFNCHEPQIKENLKLGTALTYAQAKPFLGTHFVSGDSWIPSSLPPPEEA